MGVRDSALGFLAGAWLHGAAAFLVIAAGGLSGGAAFVLALWLAAGTLRAFALGPLLGLIGLPGRPRGPRPLAGALVQVGAALALAIGASGLAGAALPAEPFTVALVLETGCRILGAAAAGLRRLGAAIHLAKPGRGGDGPPAPSE